MKLNNLINQHIEKIIYIFILFSPFMDAIAGIMLLTEVNITIGLILRFSFLVIMIYYLVFISKSKYKKLSIYMIASMFLYCILYVVYTVVSKDSSILFVEIKDLLKTFYFPLMLTALFNIHIDKKNSINVNVLIQVFIFYSFLIFMPNFLGSGFNSYGHAKIGKIGWFYAANEVGAILSILVPIVIYKLLKQSNFFFKIFAFAFIIYVFLTIGIKTPLLSFIVTILFFLFKNLISLTIRKDFKKLILIIGTSFVLGIIAIMIIPQTAFYKNIKIHMDYLEMNSISQIFTDFDYLDRFVFSDRLTFLDSKNQEYMRSNVVEKFIGLGVAHDNEMTKSVEIDYYDVFYKNGIVGFIVFFIPIILIFRIIFSKIKLDEENIIIFLSIILVFVLAFFAGHIFIAPSVSTIVIFIILNILRKQKDI